MADERIPKEAAQDDVDTSSDKADLKTRLEEQSYLLAKARTELAQEQVKSVRQDISERKSYAAKIFRLICGWVLGLLLLICGSSLSAWTNFHTPDSLLLALVGSTTATVLGLFYIVAHYLFPDREKVAKAHEEDAASSGKP